MTSPSNPKNQYEIEVASDQSDHLADSKTRKITAEQTSQVDQSAEPWTVEVVADDFKSNQKYICLPHRELL